MKKLSIIGIIGTLIWGIVIIIFLLGGFSSSESSFDSIYRLLFIMKIVVVGLYLLISIALAFVMFNNEERYLIAFGGLAITTIYCLIYLFVDGDNDFSKGLISFFSILNSVSMVEMFTFSIKSQSEFHHKFQTLLGFLVLIVFVIVGFSDSSISLSLTSLVGDSNKTLIVLLILCIVGEIINPMLGYLTKDDAFDGIVKRVVYQPAPVNPVVSNQTPLTNQIGQVTQPASPHNNSQTIINQNIQPSQSQVSSTPTSSIAQPVNQTVTQTPVSPQQTQPTGLKKEDVSPQLAFLLEQNEPTNKN